MYILYLLMSKRYLEKHQFQGFSTKTVTSKIGESLLKKMGWNAYVFFINIIVVKAWVKIRKVLKNVFKFEEEKII